MDTLDTRKTLLGSILDSSLVDLGCIEKDRIRIVGTFIQQYHEAINTLQISLKAPVAIVNDYVGGRAYPCYTPQQKELNREHLAERIFKDVWGVTPRKEDVELIVNILKEEIK